MTLLEWRDGFRIGIEEVDYEHRELIDLINAAYASVDTGRPSERLDLALGEIYAVVALHFALEEKIMRARNYAALPQHKADHERLLDDIREIMDDVAGRGVLDEGLFATRLSEWFGVHFRTHDASLHKYLAG